MKRLTRIVISASIALPLLAGCGLRGELERPDPLFEEKEEVVEPEPETVARNVTIIRRNADGGIIPNAAPSTEVDEGGLADIE